MFWLGKSSFFFLSLIVIFLNIKRYESYVIQKSLLYDLSENKISLKVEDIPKLYYPNLTVNTIPIRSLVARYYINEKDNSNALRLLKDSSLDNPYLAITNYLISRFYIEQKNDLESSFIFIKKAYNQSPKIESISSLYIALMQILEEKTTNFNNNNLIDQ